jgi:hypothetical protein
VTPKELEVFLVLCKKFGVSRFKAEGVEVEFMPTAAAGPDAKKMEILAKALGQDVLTDEQALFGSAPQAVSQDQIAEMIKRMNGG